MSKSGAIQTALWPSLDKHNLAYKRTGNALNDRPSFDTNRIFPTYVGSNELSPFHECYANEHTVLRLAVGRFFVHQNGDDPNAGYWALRRNAALFDTPERPVEISGADSVAFLERLIARPIADMKVGQGRYVLMCTHQGGLFMDGILFRLGDSRFWFVQPDGDLDTWLMAHRSGFDVAIADPHSRVLQLQGPKSYQILHAATGGALDQAFKYFHLAPFNLDGQMVYVSRTGWTGELGYEVYTRGDATDCRRLWDFLMRIGASVGLVFCSMQTMNIRRIEAGILDSGSDFDSTMTPYEAGLGKFIDLDKGDFIGRDALLSAERVTRIYGLRCAEATPRSGEQVFDAGSRVGTVTTGAYSPFLKTGIGYVRFDHPGEWRDKSLVLRTSRDGDKICSVETLPFYDAKKRLPRTLTSESGNP